MSQNWTTDQPVSTTIIHHYNQPHCYLAKIAPAPGYAGGTPCCCRLHSVIHWGLRFATHNSTGGSASRGGEFWSALSICVSHRHQLMYQSFYQFTDKTKVFGWWAAICYDRKPPRVASGYHHRMGSMMTISSIARVTPKLLLCECALLNMYSKGILPAIKDWFAVGLVSLVFTRSTRMCQESGATPRDRQKPAVHSGTGGWRLCQPHLERAHTRIPVAWTAVFICFHRLSSYHDFHRS